MFHQQDEMVSSYLFSFREASCPLFRISEFCLHSYLTPLKCQQNLVLFPRKSLKTYYTILLEWVKQIDVTSLSGNCLVH